MPLSVHNERVSESVTLGAAGRIYYSGVGLPGNQTGNQRDEIEINQTVGDIPTRRRSTLNLVKMRKDSKTEAHNDD